MINVDSCLLSFSYNSSEQMSVAAAALSYLMDAEGDVFYSRESLADLSNLGLWPNIRVVDENVRAIGAEDVDPREVVRLISDIIEQAFPVEDEFSDQLLTGQVTQFFMDPEPARLGLSADLCIPFEREIQNVARLSSLGCFDPEIFGVISKDFSGLKYKLNTEVIGDDAELSEYESEGEVGFSLIPFHKKNSMVDVDASEMWRMAIDCEGVREAVLAGLNNCILKEIDIRVGRGFWDSLVKCQAYGDGRFSSATFKVIIRSILATMSGRGEPFWTDTKRTDVRQDGTYSAYRFHVSTAKEGLRLMLWFNGEKIVLANVGVKKEEIIIPLKDCI